MQTTPLKSDLSSYRVRSQLNISASRVELLENTFFFSRNPKIQLSSTIKNEIPKVPFGLMEHTPMENGFSWKIVFDGRSKRILFGLMENIKLKRGKWRC